VSRQLPPQLPYTAPGTSPKDFPYVRYISDIDVLRQYDAAAVDLFRMPLVREDVRFYAKEELEFYSVQKLRNLADLLGVNAATDNRDLLIKAVIMVQQIPVVLASPNPAYSAQELVTGRREGSPMSSNVRYPIISVQRLAISSRPGTSQRVKYRGINWVGQNQAVIQGFKPNGISISYQVECLSTLTTHMNFMDSWIYRMWNVPVVVIQIDLGEPWGVKTIHVLKNSSYSDATEYEQDASVAEKLVRHIHTIEIEGWMPTPVWLTPTVIRFTAGYYDMVTGQLIEDGVKQNLDQ
jgi:hypothetical protein